MAKIENSAKMIYETIKWEKKPQIVTGLINF